MTDIRRFLIDSGIITPNPLARFEGPKDPAFTNSEPCLLLDWNTRQAMAKATKDTWSKNRCAVYG